MVRDINEIEQEILEAKANSVDLKELNSTSKVSIWRLFVYIISRAIWTLEKLFDKHAKQVDEKIKQGKPHTARWYRNKALEFQYGFDLYQDSDVFNNTGKTEEQIVASKVIKYCAVVESKEESRLIVKIAGEQKGKLSKLDSNVEEAFKAYLAEIKDAGVNTTVINYLPDLLLLKIKIVRDILVLDTNGMNRMTGRYPVNEAIQEFMKKLPFNGELSLQHLIDRIQEVEGVRDLSLSDAKTSWIDSEVNTYGNWEGIEISKIPDSGYFTVNLDKNDNTKSEIIYV